MTLRWVDDCYIQTRKTRKHASDGRVERFYLRKHEFLTSTSLKLEEEKEFADVSGPSPPSEPTRMA